MEIVVPTPDVWLLDLDGTLNTIDIEDESKSPEVAAYITAAAEFVSKAVPSLGSADAVRARIIEEIRNVFPQRDVWKNWGTFPDSQNVLRPVAPAVDHFLLVPLAVERLLSDVDDVEADAFKNMPKGWRYPLYNHSSNASIPHSAIEPEAKAGIEKLIVRPDCRVAIFTNSSPEKARALLMDAGFGGYLVDDELQSGKIGVVGNGKKFVIDPGWGRPAQTKFSTPTIDVGAAFGAGAHIDLRRKTFYDKLRMLLGVVQPKRVVMASDIPELDHWPVADWAEFSTLCLMKRNPVSSRRSEDLAVEHLGAVVRDSLDELVDVGVAA